MNTNIIAIGGGEIREDFPGINTLLIDQVIVESSNKKNPNFLFIPTASSDNQVYCDAIKKHFSKLGCEVDNLLLIKEKPSKELIIKKINKADIIYVGGGNTLKMMMIWRKLGIDELLIAAKNKGVILSGISAGSICWFDSGNSDSRKFKNPNHFKLIEVKGLGIIKAMNCPHYLVEENRKKSLASMTQKNNKIAIALDDGAAIHIKNNEYRIIKSSPSAGAFKVYWKNGVFYEEPLNNQNHFESLEKLIKK